MSSDSLWIVLDDTDPQISYSGPWLTNTSTNLLNQETRSGNTYNNTLHASTSNDTTLSFRFNGTSYMGVYGTWDTTENPGIYPDVDCTLDGKRMTSFATASSNIGTVVSNQILCRSDDLTGAATTPGEHELKLNVTNAGSKLLIDYLVYQALPGAPLDGNVLQLGNGVIGPANEKESMLNFGSGWGGTVTDAKSASTPGSSVTVKFNGTSAVLMGELSGNNSNSASYTIDGGDPVTFELLTPGVTVTEAGSSQPSYTNQVLFNVSGLDPKEHTLVVTHTGSASGMPLVVDYFLLTSLTSKEQAALSSSSSSSSSSPSPSSSSASDSAKHSSTNAGAIAGAIVGVVALLALIAAALFFLRRRRRARRAQAELPDPYPIHDVETTQLYSPASTSNANSRNPTLNPLRSMHNVDGYGLPSSHETTEFRDTRPSSTLEEMKQQQRRTLAKASPSSSSQPVSSKLITMHPPELDGQPKASSERRLPTLPSGQRRQQPVDAPLQSGQNLTSPHSTSAPVTMHTDSGLRWNGSELVPVEPIEIPPYYTPE